MTNTPDRITSKSNARIKELCKLKDHPSREGFLIEGKHLVDMAYESGALLEVFSITPVSYEGVAHTLVSCEVLQKLAFSPSPSGIMGLAKAPLRRGSSGKSLFLDRVQDPGNVGTLLRSALSFGYDRVLLTQGTASPFGYKVVAASQGAVFKLEIVEVADPLSALSQLRRQGETIIASALRNATPLREFPKPSRPFVLILGNEGRGVDEQILDVSDHVLKIEMEGIDSLNVGVAGGVLMYEL